MSIALDIGTNKIRVLESQKPNTVTGQQCPSAYLAIRDTETMRQVLENRECPYSLCQEYLTVIGDDIYWLSELMGLPLTSLFPEGVIPADDPPARQLINSILESLLPVPKTHGEACVVTLPSGKTGKTQSEKRENNEFLLRLIELRGYEPIICSQSQALIVSELAQNSFTGIGMTFGASSVEASFLNCGKELVNCSLQQAGNWIDETMAEQLGEYQYDDKGIRFLNTESIRKWKESLESNPLRNSHQREKLLETLCRQLLDRVIHMIHREIAPVIMENHFHSPIPLVVSGNSARIPGFGKILKEKIDQAEFPFELNRVKLAIDSDYTIARGLLIQSVLESDDYQIAGKIAA